MAWKLRRWLDPEPKIENPECEGAKMGLGFRVSGLRAQQREQRCVEVFGKTDVAGLFPEPEPKP